MRSPLFKKLPSCVLGAVIAASTVMSVPVNAVDGNPPGLFELEGNIPDAATAGDDWGGLYANTATKANLITFTGITADPAPASIFTQGGSKDVNDVSEWKHTNGSVPDKDDITNAYAAAYNNPTDVCFNGTTAVTCAEGQTPVHEAGDMIIYFGLDRYANNGDAFAGFWFFQDDVAPQSNGTFSGNHVARRDDPNSSDPNVFLPGDIFVIVQYPQASGAVPLIKVYEWDPNDVDGDKNWDPDESTKPPTRVSSPLDLLIRVADAECDLAGGKLACAISNLTAQATPPWPYTPKAGTGLPYESFFEGGINVTRLLGSTPCFASFLAETRSSSSQTAQLKDFVQDAFPVCGISVAKDCAAELNTNGNGVDVTFTGTVSNTGGSTIIGYVKDDQTGSTIDEVCVDTGAPGCADDADVAGLVKQADGSAYFPLGAGVTVRYEGSYSVTGLPSGPLTDEVTALGFQDADDVDTPSAAIVSATDTAECSFDVNAGLVVVKECSVAFLNGDSAEVTISGTVENTGDVPLSSVTVTDSDFGALTFPTTLAVGATEPFTKTVSVAYADLAPTVSAPDADGKVTVTLNHSDTVTATGEVLAADGETVLDSASNSDSATCSDTFTRDIALQKDCDEVVLVPEGGKLVVKAKVTVTVSNTGDEDLTVTSLTDNPAVTFDTATPFVLPAGGEPVVVNGFYFPTSTSEIGGPLTNLSFPDTASVSATGAFSGASATASDDADCPLCPTPTP